MKNNQKTFQKVPNKTGFLTYMLVGEQKEMDYTNENYAEDNEIATEVYRIYFRGFQYLKDDLIQEALIKLWQKRSLYNGSTAYKTFATAIAKNAMYDFLRKELNHLNQDISIFEELETGQNYMDILETEQDGCINELNDAMVLGMTKMYLSHCDERTQKVFKLLASGATYDEISQDVGLSKSSIYELITKLKNKIVTKIVEVRQ